MALVGADRALEQDEGVFFTRLRRRLTALGGHRLPLHRESG